MSLLSTRQTNHCIFLSLFIWSALIFKFYIMVWVYNCICIFIFILYIIIHTITCKLVQKVLTHNINCTKINWSYSNIACIYSKHYCNISIQLNKAVTFSLCFDWGSRDYIAIMCWIQALLLNYSIHN